MSMQNLFSCALIATHLNAPYGLIVTPEDIKRALASGTVTSISDTTGQALVSRLFQEHTPALILRAGREAHAGMPALFSLYKESLAWGSAPIPAWEAMIRQAGTSDQEYPEPPAPSSESNETTEPFPR